ERGEISLCFKGNIARDLEVDTLRERLQALFEEESTSGVASEAEAAASIGKAMAALAASESSSSATSEEPRPAAPSRSTTRVPVTQSTTQNSERVTTERAAEPSS